jgi:ZIP family zinc transporter
MLAASFTSLILPGIKLGGILPVLLGIILGAAAISMMDHLIPHMHAIMGIERGPRDLRLGKERGITYNLIAGLIVTLYLDTLFSA